MNTHIIISHLSVSALVSVSVNVPLLLSTSSSFIKFPKLTSLFLRNEIETMMVMDKSSYLIVLLF